MNKKRVRLIKRLIYAFIIIVLFLPLILMSFLALRMISISQTMQDQLQTLTSAIGQSSQQPSSQGGYVIEPEGQSTNGESPEPQTTDGKNTDTAANDQAPDSPGAQPDASGTSPTQLTSDAGGASVNDVGNSSLNGLNGGGQTGSDTTGGSTGGEDNPNAGADFDSEVIPPNYNGNPGMGC